MYDYHRTDTVSASKSQQQEFLQCRSCKAVSQVSASRLSSVLCLLYHMNDFAEVQNQDRLRYYFSKTLS